MSRPKLYIIQGFIGSGKTTYSKQLADEASAVRLNADEYCEQEFSPEELETNWDECFAKSIDALWSKAHELLKQNQDVILDFGFWTFESREHARMQAEKSNAEFIHIYLDIDDETLLSRLRKRRGEIAQSNLENFSTLQKSFEPPRESENATTVNSRPENKETTLKPSIH